MFSTVKEMDKQPIHWSQNASMVSDISHNVIDANDNDPIYQTVDLEERLDTTLDKEDLETKPKHDCLEVNKSSQPIDANVCDDDPLYSVVNKKKPKALKKKQIGTLQRQFLPHLFAPHQSFRVTAKLKRNVLIKPRFNLCFT
ncbi:hypothetical protein DPMN_179213 [Dreissena polymorpha]|uniref:Uncharacterized protein n=1 Tax=Dreissena polymorpha TaxID=45954 RepID=A0A9D4EGJ9_DREPO|nr:hypothetical protein DPMN_179213 [Dreissena polymorpha]